MEFIAISEARYIAGYRIFIKFNNGEYGEVDLERIVFKYPASVPLRDVYAFSQFYLDSWPTLAWSCGFDVSPEYLYEIAIGTPLQMCQAT